MSTRDLRDLFESFSPTPEQREAILDRLLREEEAVRAARPVKLWKKSLLAAACAAVLLLACAFTVASGLDQDQKLMALFGAGTEDARQIAGGVVQVDQVHTYDNGWTAELKQVLVDRYTLAVLVELTGPEGMALPEENCTLFAVGDVETGWAEERWPGGFVSGDEVGKDLTFFRIGEGAAIAGHLQRIPHREGNRIKDNLLHPCCGGLSGQIHDILLCVVTHRIEPRLPAQRGGIIQPGPFTVLIVNRSIQIGGGSQRILESIDPANGCDAGIFHLRNHRSKIHCRSRRRAQLCDLGKTAAIGNDTCTVLEIKIDAVIAVGHAVRNKTAPGGSIHQDTLRHINGVQCLSSKVSCPVVNRLIEKPAGCCNNGHTRNHSAGFEHRT